MFAWGKARLAPDAFLNRLAKGAKLVPSNPRLPHVLDNLSLMHVDIGEA